MKNLIILTSLLLFTSISNSAIYKWTDAQGKLHFGDRKPDAQQAEEVKLRKLSSFKSVTFMTRKDTKADGNLNVVMYSAEWCGYCKKARNYFKNKNIQFTEYDIEKDPVAAKDYKSMGATGVPVILVGNKRMNGFSIKGFERIYKK